MLATTSTSSYLPPATTSERRPDARMMVIQGRSGEIEHTRLNALPHKLSPGDLLVVNDAGTIPASIKGTTATHAPIELRLAASLDAEHWTLRRWIAVVMGEGDWRTDTDLRPPPPHLSEGDILHFSGGLQARIENILHASGRLVTIALSANNGDLWDAIYTAGQPIQYAYHTQPIAVWDQQTLFSGPPVAVEPPSSAFHMTWSLMFQLLDRGVEVVPITHGTGLSTTGDPALDAVLPLFEPTAISEHAAKRINAARARGARIIAQGTGVTRALESMAHSDGTLFSGRALSTMRLSSSSTLQIVDGLLTGVHDPESSHGHLLESFIPAHLIRRSFLQAATHGYLGHEYGDVALIMA